MSCRRCSVMARQVAELEAEVAALRAAAQDVAMADHLAEDVDLWRRRARLTGAQAIMLRLLVHRAGRVLSIEALAQAVMDAPGRPLDRDASNAAVRVHIFRIRRALKAQGVALNIESVRGLGYRLPAPDALAVLDAVAGGRAVHSPSSKPLEDHHETHH